MLKFGHCENCKFSEPIWKGHMHFKTHGLFCRRFPPAPPGYLEVWNKTPPVKPTDGCWEYQEKES